MYTAIGDKTTQMSNAHSDTRFITNEAGQTLADRFAQLIGEDTEMFDCLVGYFYSSGFYLMEPALQSITHIRILIGLASDVKESVMTRQSTIDFQSTNRFIEKICDQVRSEYEGIDENEAIEQGASRFVEWLRSGKIEVRAYLKARLHAKLYILTYEDGARDAGRVVTGSSNFSEAGLKSNLEINVELKDRGDYDFAVAKFEELWADSEPIGETLEDTITRQTWLRDDITPYELWLKFLYEYFRGELNLQHDSAGPLPDEPLRLEYQTEAVRQAIRIIRQYGGVFLADVVGLGKTYMAVRVAHDWTAEKGGRTLVIGPPKLIDENTRSHEGSWRFVCGRYGLRDPWFQSSGSLDTLLEEDLSSVSTVIVDESHNFRSDETNAYTCLSQICHNKAVILVSATPYNNRPSDIQNQIKLFQAGTDCKIPTKKNLDGFFTTLKGHLKSISRKTHPIEHQQISAENARKVREEVMRHVTVRRLRSEIVKYYSKDLKKQGIVFPTVGKPEPLYYQMDAHLEAVFDETISLLKQVSYARYTPLLYCENEIPEQRRIGQENLKKFMRILLVKRLESSFVAFKTTAQNALSSQTAFLRKVEAGHVWVATDGQSAKLRQALLDDDDEALFNLWERGEVNDYTTEDFSPNFLRDLKADIDRFTRIQSIWESIDHDPKLERFLDALAKDPALRDGRPIIFTEATATAHYLSKEIKSRTERLPLISHGGQTKSQRAEMLENFDANRAIPRTDYDMLITTDVNAEGVNLHASNIVVNYDLPWNPTRMIQRVGRVNRVGTKHSHIHTYNFFPSREGDSELDLEALAVSKIAAFLELLGNDAYLLTDQEDIGARDLHDRVKKTSAVTGEEEGEDEEYLSELPFLEEIKAIRDHDEALFDRIKALPKKARSYRVAHDDGSAGLITFFRAKSQDQHHIYESEFDRPTLTHIVYSWLDEVGDISTERLTIHTAAKRLRATPKTPCSKVTVKDKAHFYELYKANVADMAAHKDEQDSDNAVPNRPINVRKLLNFLSVAEKHKGLTDEDQMRLKTLIKNVKRGVLAKGLVKSLLDDLAKAKDSLAIARILLSTKTRIYQQKHKLAGQSVDYSDPEVVLSSYALGEQDE